MNKNLIISFCFGVIAGAAVVKIIDSSKLRRLEEFEKEVQAQSKKLDPTEYIDILDFSEDGENNDTRSDDIESESFLGEDADHAWTKVDRERVSEFLQNEECLESISTELSENSSVETGDVELQLVTDLKDNLVLDKTINLKKAYNESVHSKSNDGDDSSNNETNEDSGIKSNSGNSKDSKDNSIQLISAVEFVKAVTAGAQMRSFIFDIMTGKLYWNFTDEPLDDDEVDRYLGFDLLQDIMNESISSHNHWIEPKYLHDNRDNTYTKIEAGGVIW